ncbi:MAG: transglycosylase SLT domain-containing protein [Rhodocyclaceae bacterium]|nr:transglycosylase SLT domain-containing protein [Rhodocyclaceae bacterium]
MSDSQALPAIFSDIPSARQGLLLLVEILLLAGIVYALAGRAATVRPPPVVADVAVKSAPAPAPSPAAPQAAVEASRTSAEIPSAEILTPRMRAALDYASRRYRVSAEALAPIFAAVQRTARDLRLDPLLVVAVVGIESGFNPFSESAMGAQGLMQVIPRYHRDKLPEDAGRLHLFDPVANIRVGTLALHEYISRSGDVVDGLQEFAGNPDDPEQAYAAKVLAEKERLESAALHHAPSRSPVHAAGPT